MVWGGEAVGWLLWRLWLLWLLWLLWWCVLGVCERDGRPRSSPSRADRPTQFTPKTTTS